MEETGTGPESRRIEETRTVRLVIGSESRRMEEVGTGLE